ncbi:transcription antitermination protein NusB [Neolewinella lacunae]|uniref:Transcription antitermination protein NusB n=1 Tax=Neolewinella lacunae TaxID=1517758 RepID=A0A923PTG7_9BACT|nr:transcription antitermination protein NusB [Neolewinella lacunae]MBC6996517.1 transcription antitermination protein NusB [Neolewinella lacunae]MDN3634918.1 transcription antitermination protein NusB [Neolewinella lacunae]
MLSRRNVRIKIMQVLYAAQRQELTSPKAFDSMLMSMARNTFKFYLQNLLIIQRVAEYAKHDLATRKAKLRPTEEDKAFRAILADNAALKSLSDNTTLSRVYEEYGLRAMIDADHIQKLYRDFLKTDDWQWYHTLEAPALADNISILLRLFKWLQAQELYLNMIEDHFPLWKEDKSLVVGAVKKTLKAMPLEEDFYRVYQENGEAIDDFGRPLLKFVVEADAQLLARIKTVLQNWDAERVAIVDMILIKMAMGEFTQFPAIAAEVTINEYVDISKSYSTDKSREFINGVLDNLRKAFEKEGLV